MSCLVRVGGVNTTGDKTVLSCINPVSKLQLFSLKYIQDYWKLGNWKLGRDETKLSRLVCSCVHTADTDKTRQFCHVRIGSVIVLKYKPNFQFCYAYINNGWTLNKQRPPSVYSVKSEFHLSLRKWVDCQETGISSMPNSRNRVWDYFTLPLPRRTIRKLISLLKWT